MSDLRTTYRQLRRTPAHVATVILSLAAGMAVCGAAFSAIQTLLFSAVPGVVDRSGLLRIRWIADGGRLTSAELDGLAALAGRDFDGLAAQSDRVVPVALAGEVVSARAAFVSGDTFATLGTTPLRGRLLGRGDDRAGAEAVVVLGEAFWRRRFAGDPDVIGRAVAVDGRSATVVGVAPRGFGGLRLDIGDGAGDVPEIWLPLDRRAPHAPWLSVAARARPGSGPGDAQARLSVLAETLERQSPSSHQPARLQVFRAGLDWRQSPRDSVLVVGLFLLVPLAMLGVGCANVANLQLARAVERTRELSVRLTLGASRARLVRLLVLEVGFLAVAAAGVGTAGAAFLLGRASAIAALPLALDPSIVALLALLVAGIVAVAGLGPAWMASRDVVATGLRLTSGAAALTRLRGALVVFQVAVSTLLLFMTTLGVRTLDAVRGRLPADADRLVVAELDLSTVRPFSPTVARTIVDAALATLHGSDAVDGAAAATFFRHGMPSRFRLTSDAPGTARAASVGHVTTGWFDVTGTRLLAGRAPVDGERSRAVVSASLARSFGEPRAALGRDLQVLLGQDPITVTVTAVAEDASAAAPPTIYLPLSPATPPFVVLTARARTPAAGREALRAAIRAAHPALPRDRIATFDRKVADDARGLEGFIGVASGIAASTLVLAAAGVFALLSFTVRRRRREIGVRVAVGATRADVVALVVRQAVVLAVCGSAAGLVAGVGLAYVMRAALAGVSPVAVSALLPATALLLAATLLASAVPAWRALGIAPTESLRDE
jgi:predicted permease